MQANQTKPKIPLKALKQINYIVQNEKLTLQYIPGNGAWTYQLIIPNTKDIKGKWGDLKVSGTIDGYEIKHKNLGPVKNSDKKMAINSEIRNAINKQGGDTVTVTLYLENQTINDDSSEILECFKDAQVLHVFKQLNQTEQTQILKEIHNVATQDQKAEKIIKAIETLENKRQ
jgi:ABC-type antimicrobial peptide transport system ATPase subunit